MNAKLTVADKGDKATVSLLIGVFFLLQLVVAFFTYYHSLTFDEAMWQYIGRNWFRNGLTPYAGGIDNKSPLIFAVFGLSDKLFGVNFWFPRLLGICFQTTGIFFLYKLGKILFSRSTALMAAIIYGLTLAWHVSGAKYVSNTESYSVACIIAAWYLSLSSEKNSQVFIAGIVAGVSCALRLTGFFGTIALVLTLLIKKKQNPTFLLMGALTMIFFFAVFFELLGINLHDLFTNQFFDNFSHGGVAGHSLNWRIQNFYDNFLRSGMLILLPGLVIYCFTKKENNGLLIWLFLEFAGISIVGMYASQHFKNLLAPFALINANAFNYLTGTRKISPKWSIPILCLFIFPISTEPLLSVKKIIFPPHPQIEMDGACKNQQPDDDARKRLGIWIKENSSVSDKVFIAGYGAQIQAYSERISPSVYFNVTQTETAQKRLFEDLASDKPAMILIPEFPEYERLVNPDFRNFVSNMVTRDYRYDRCLYGYGIYRRNPN